MPDVSEVLKTRERHITAVLVQHTRKHQKRIQPLRRNSGFWTPSLLNESNRSQKNLIDLISTSTMNHEVLVGSLGACQSLACKQAIRRSDEETN